MLQTTLKELNIPIDDILPTQHNLPSEDNKPMETERHKLQMELLIDSLRPWLDQRPDGYIGGNMFIYYNINQLRHQDFRGADVFVVLDVPKGERKSWVVWEEGKGPDFVIELLSETTAQTDKTEKKRIYEKQLKVEEYFWYDPFNVEDWAGFERRQGQYQRLALDPQGRLVSQQLKLALVRWNGTYKNVEATWLRWETLQGDLLPTPEEIAEQQQQRAERLANQLREMGIDPTKI
jgi:Uma2 family endonuclease